MNKTGTQRIDVEATPLLPNNQKKIDKNPLLPGQSNENQIISKNEGKSQIEVVNKVIFSETDAQITVNLNNNENKSIPAPKSIKSLKLL